MPAGRLSVPAGTPWRRLLRVALQPHTHYRDLALLSSDNRFGKPPDLRIATEGEHYLCHIDGALMMRDHAVYEISVSISSEGDIHRFMHSLIDSMEGSTGGTAVALRFRGAAVFTPGVLAALPTMHFAVHLFLHLLHVMMNRAMSGLLCGTDRAASRHVRLLT